MSFIELGNQYFLHSNLGHTMPSSSGLDSIIQLDEKWKFLVLRVHTARLPK
jgi:hypothetical protein